MTDQSAKKNAFITEASTLEAKAKSNVPSESENESEEEDYYSENPYYQTITPAQSTFNDLSQTKGSKQNQSEKSNDEFSTVGEGGGEKRPISAVAPKVLDQDESHVEISSTPAFQCLEEVGLFN